MFTREFLIGWRHRALRRGVWYSALDRVERGIVSLTARVVDRVDSEVLGVELVKILAKLVRACKSGFVRHMEMFGLGRVCVLSRLAVEWGNSVAKGWAYEMGFVGYVSMMDLNQPTGFGV
jgi:hypothetical protein